MLWSKVIASVYSVPDIQYVGGYVTTGTGTISNIDVSLTSLSGGLGTSPAAGDLVIVYFGTGSQNNRSLVIEGYTTVADLYQDGASYDTNFIAGYKIMGSTPDVQVTLRGTSSTSDATAVIVQVWRNASIGSAASFTQTGSNFDPPSVTPVANGSWVVVGGAAAHGDGVDTFTSPDLSGFITDGANSVNDVSIGAGYYEWTSGTFDPQQWTNTSGGSGKSSAGVTIVLTPA